MTPRVVEAVKRLLDAKIPYIERLSIQWFGGEPLLAKDILLDIMRFAHHRTAEGGLRLISGATTNAYLLDIDTAHQLVSVGVRDFEISFDGDEADHDETRRLASGNGTFARIWQNLLDIAARPLDLRITLRVHLTTGNADAIEAFLDRAIDRFGEDPRFFFFTKAVENLGGAGARAVVLEHQSAAALCASLEERVPHGRLVQVQEGYVCCTARPNSFIVRADGAVGKCTVALNAAANGIGRVLDRGEFELDVERLSRWFRGFDTLDKTVLGVRFPPSARLRRRVSRRSVRTRFDGP